MQFYSRIQGFSEPVRPCNGMELNVTMCIYSRIIGLDSMYRGTFNGKHWHNNKHTPRSKWSHVTSNIIFVAEIRYYPNQWFHNHSTIEPHTIPTNLYISENVWIANMSEWGAREEEEEEGKKTCATNSSTKHRIISNNSHYLPKQTSVFICWDILCFCLVYPFYVYPRLGP